MILQKTSSYNNYLPVKAYAQNSEVLQAGDEKLLVGPPVAELLAGSVKDGHLAHAAPVPVVQGAGRGVAWGHADSLNHNIHPCHTQHDIPPASHMTISTPASHNTMCL